MTDRWIIVVFKWLPRWGFQPVRVTAGPASKAEAEATVICQIVGASIAIVVGMPSDPLGVVVVCRTNIG